MVNINLTLDLNEAVGYNELGRTIEQVITERAIESVVREVAGMLRENAMSESVRQEVAKASAAYFQQYIEPLMREAIDDALEAVFGTSDPDDIRRDIANQAEALAKRSVSVALQNMSLDISGRR